MKKQQIQEMKNKPEAELRKMLREDRDKLRGLKFDLAAGKVKDIAELREMRKNIARILTFLNQGKDAHPNKT